MILYGRVKGSGATAGSKFGAGVENFCQFGQRLGARMLVRWV